MNAETIRAIQDEHASHGPGCIIDWVNGRKPRCLIYRLASAFLHERELSIEIARTAKRRLEALHVEQKLTKDLRHDALMLEDALKGKDEIILELRRELERK